MEFYDRSPMDRPFNIDKRRNRAVRELSSYSVFSMFIKYDEHSNCDATGIVSKECYEKWIASRRKLPKFPEKAFRRALTAHLRGVDGRRPFEPQVEASLLGELRKKKVWNCFEGIKNCKIGVHGFPSSGYHEGAWRNSSTLKAKPENYPVPVDVKTSIGFKRQRCQVIPKSEEIPELFSLLCEPGEKAVEKADSLPPLKKEKLFERFEHARSNRRVSALVLSDYLADSDSETSCLESFQFPEMFSIHEDGLY